MPETIKAYLETAAEQIRWKRARPLLVQELERHLEDQRDDFIKEGKSREEAERLAVEDMGDPVTVGTELDAVHRPRAQWGLLGLTIALALAGAFLRVSFLCVSDGPYANQTAALVKTLASLGLGTTALLGMYFLDVSRLARHARTVYIGALAAGMMSLRLFPVYTHPSYHTHYVVLFYPLAYAFWLYSFRGKGWRGMALSILGGVPLSLVCMRIPSFMGLITLLLSGLILTLAAVWEDWFGIGRTKGICAVLTAVACMLGQLFFRGYIAALIRKFSIALHPERDPLGQGFIGSILHQLWENIPPLQQHGTIGAAVNAGARVRVYMDGDSLKTGCYTPLDFSSDFLPVTMAVQWGWIPLALLLLALAALLVWILVKGLRQRQRLGRFVVLAVTLTLGFHFLFSIALNLGIAFCSASLPLVVGNLYAVLDMALIGLALSVFRGEAVSRDDPVIPSGGFGGIRLRIEVE